MLTQQLPPEARITGAVTLIEGLRRHAEREETQRLSLLMAHAGLNLLLGLLLLQAADDNFTAPNWAWLTYVPGRQTPVGAAFFSGGLLLSWGVMTRTKRPPGLARYATGLWLQIYGIVLIMGSDLLFGAGFTWAHFTQTPVPPLYPLAVYLGLAVLMSTHLSMVVFYLANGYTSWTHEDSALVARIQYDDRSKETTAELITAVDAAQEEHHVGH